MGARSADGAPLEDPEQAQLEPLEGLGGHPAVRGGPELGQHGLQARDRGRLELHLGGDEDARRGEDLDRALVDPELLRRPVQELES